MNIFKTGPRAVRRIEFHLLTIFRRLLYTGKDIVTSGDHSINKITSNVAIYSYAPALREFGNDIAMVRFPDDERPWQWLRFQDGRVFPRGAASSTSVEMAQLWWDVWDKHQLQV